ncbi:hypothetical protein [Thalassotalea sp. PLHSN55]|uniref:hypothetical protein n=1 Tax=Thalassotalea sp. PLHSN55 TaxID=3435888 RepID=UPI003F872EED
MSVCLLLSACNVTEPLIPTNDSSHTSKQASSFNVITKPQDFKRLQQEKMESSSTVTWQQIGPGMAGNNMHVHWHNTDPNILFLGPNMDNAYRSVDKGHTWHTLFDADGPGYQTRQRGPYDIQSPEFSYQNPDFGFATTEDEATIWQTNDRGKTWLELPGADKTFDVLISDIEVDPSNDNIWYAGTGKIYNVNDFGFSDKEPHGFYRKPKNYQNKAQVWKTSNRGKSWQRITPQRLNKTANITKIIVHPKKTNVLFLATTYGFYKSTDAGETWQLNNSNGFDHNIIRAIDMHVDKSSGKVTLYAIDLVKWKIVGKTIANDGGGVFVSHDEGESWQNINGNLDINVKKMAKTDHYFKNHYYKQGIAPWFGIKDSQAPKLFPSLPESLMHRLARVIVDPNNPERIFVFNDYKGKSEYTFTGGIVWRTDDGGKNWYVTFRNGTAWEGVHKEYWQSRNNPTQHNVTFKSQRKWKLENSYFKKAGSAFQFNADGSVLAGQIAKVFMVSYDHGDNWQEIDEIELSFGSEAWVAGGNSNMPGQGMVQDARIPNTMFFTAGENDYWYTVAGGNTVRPNAQAAVRNHMQPHGEFSVSTIAFHPDDVNTVYSLQTRQSHMGALLKSTEGGKNFELYGQAVPKWERTSKFGDQSIHQRNLTIDPENPNYMYFNVPKDGNELNWVGNSQSSFGMHRSIDGGKNWRPINAGLPKPFNVANFKMDPDNSAVLFAGVYGRKGEGGLYVSENHGESWAKMALPKGVFSVVDIHFSKDGKFYLSTGHKGAKPGEGGLYVSDKKRPEQNDWKKVFDMPWTGSVKTAAYDPNVILLTVMSTASIGYINPGAYLSKDGGKRWIKINRGNGQSDRINDVAIDMFEPNLYYVSTRGAGVFISR